jgi:CTP synthase
MRRGAHDCAVTSGTRLAEIYGRTPISERHHHRWEFDMQYRPALEKAGMVLSGISSDGHWLEAVELDGHPFFIGVIFHPEFKSRPTRPHPLFTSLVTAVVRRKFGDT